MTYAIRLPDGRLITDPGWHSVADVMAGAHGQGGTRVVGDLVRLDDTDPTRIVPTHAESLEA